jgi:cysteine desulfurase/selenocysteine lyase
MAGLTRYRTLFPITERSVYFNHAGTGPMSVPAQQAIQKCIDTYSSKAEFGIDEYFSLVNEARGNVAHFINANAEEITFTHNTSEGIYIALMNLALKPGDEIIVMSEVFPAVRYIVDHNLPGISKKYVTFSGRDPVEVIRKNIHARSRAVVVDHVQFLSGEVLDLVALSRYTREKGIYLVVDGIQAIGAMEYDAKQLDLDFMACGSAKWLFGPSGTGFLYVNKRNFQHIQTMHSGWLGADWPGFEDIALEPPLYPDARKYELGTRNIMGISALSANVNILLQFHMKHVHERIAKLKTRLRRFFEDSQYEIITPKLGLQSGIISCRKTADMRELYNKLQESGIIVSLRNGYLRFSPHFYNTEEEVDGIIDTIEHYPA